MRLRIVVIVFFFFVVHAAHAGQDSYVRGAVIWTNERQTVTECKTGRVYWLRILASNPHVIFSKKVEELSSKDAKITAVFQGEISPGVPSLGPLYPVDGTLNVYQVISIQQGTCEK
jgi:hypothetical protein